MLNEIIKTLKKIICFDIDGVICNTNSKDYKKSTPIKKNIKKINELYNKGYFIKIFTARYMGRSNNKINIATKKAKKLTIFQLNKWGLSYHKVIFGKPSYSLFVDDCNIFYRDNWIKHIEKKLKKI